MAVDDIEALNYDDLSAVALLAASDCYKSIMQVRAAIKLLSLVQVRAAGKAARTAA